MATSLKGKSKTTIKDEKIQQIASKIDQTDEMKLKMLSALGQPDLEDALFPPELNAHLIEQLKVMTCENNELRKCVFTKDEEIKELNKTIKDLNQRIRDIISGNGPAISSKSAGIISAKITELCKQNRHLVAEVEGYKTKNASLERKIMQLEILNKEHEKLDVCLCKEEPPVDCNSDELKDLNNKLAAVNKKLYESKNRNLELKNDILLATKILQQELGDKFTSIKELQNDLAGWKGRAQQIVVLQSRIAELEEKLNGKHKDLIEAKRKDQSQLLKDIEAKRKKEVDNAMKELEALKLENAELKRKLDGAKCRVKNLECDSMMVKQKMQTFVEKSQHDDMLINEQRNQMKSVEFHYQELLKENTVKINKLQSEVANYEKQIQNTDAKIEALRNQASDKSAKIDELRAQLLRYEECSLQSVFFTPMKTATDNEIKKLTDLVLTLNERLGAERLKWDELETSNRKLNEKKRRLERKIHNLDEKLRIAELPKKNSRVSKSSIHTDTFPVQSAQSAKKMSSVSAVPEMSSSEEPSTESYESLEKDDLKYKLELADEKLKIMEDKLKMIEEEKQEDYQNLTEMIQTSKQLFNEALTILQREKCMCTEHNS